MQMRPRRPHSCCVPNMAARPLPPMCRDGWGDADVRYSKDLNIKDDKSYIMSLLAVLTSGDSAAGYQIKELGGSFHENGYSIPQMQIRRKEKKNGF